MSICRICRFETELDDVVARALRRDLQATLATLEPA